MLKNKNFHSKLKDKSNKEFDWSVNFKASKEKIGNNRYWKDLLAELCQVLLKNLSFSVNSPFFEEYSNLILRELKKLYKNTLIMIEKKEVLKKAVILLDFVGEKRFENKQRDLPF